MAGSRRLARAGVLAVTAAAPLVVLLGGPALAALPHEASDGTVVTPVAADAWYSASSACTLTPVGCVPAGPGAVYPPKTLHIGVAAGQEEARTYLSLDLGGLPPGAAVTGGTLRLPVSGTQDGSRVPDTATLKACPTTAAVVDAIEGSTDKPPAVDCVRASATAKYVPATATAPAMFTVDLGPLVAARSGAAALDPIALLPADKQPPTADWHVALSAHDRKMPPVPPPSASLTYTLPGTDSTSGVRPFPPNLGLPGRAPLNVGGSVTPPLTSGTAPLNVGGSVTPPLTSGTAPLSVGEPVLPGVVTAAVPPPAVAPVPAVAGEQLQPRAFSLPGLGHYDYPEVFLLPLFMAGAIAWAGRAMTRDLVGG